MELTYFLAQLIGVYLLVWGLVMLLRKEAYLEALHDFYGHAASRLLAGWIALTLGLLLVLNYNYWDVGMLPLVITLIGWVALLKGLALLFIPKSTAHWARAIKLEQMCWLYALVTLVVGAYLAYAGFAQAGLL